MADCSLVLQSCCYCHVVKIIKLSFCSKRKTRDTLMKCNARKRDSDGERTREHATVYTKYIHKLVYLYLQPATTAATWNFEWNSESNEIEQIIFIFFFLFFLSALCLYPIPSLIHSINLILVASRTVDKFASEKIVGTLSRERERDANEKIFLIYLSAVYNSRQMIWSHENVFPHCNLINIFMRNFWLSL